MPGNANSGRATRGQELNVTRYYEELLPKAFAIAAQRLGSRNKKDQDWAMDWLKSGFIKLLPNITKVGGDPDNQTAIPISILQGATQKPKVNV